VNIADMTLDDHIEKELLLIKVKAAMDGERDLPDIIQSSGARVLDDSPETYTLELTVLRDPRGGAQRRHGHRPRSQRPQRQSLAMNCTGLS
jgi:hypothetical protein